MHRLLAALLLLSSSAYAANPSQSTSDIVDRSITLAATNTWQQIAKPDGARSTMTCMNVGSNNMGLYINTYANANATPVPAGIGSTGVFTMVPTGSYEPDGGWIYGGAVWAIGTMNDVITCKFGTSQP